MDEAFERLSNSISFQSQQIVNAATAAATAFALPFLDSFQDVLTAFQGLQSALQAEIDTSAISPFQDIIRDAAESVEQFIKQLAEDLPAALNKVDTSGLLSAFRELGTSFGGLFDALEISDAEGIADTLQSVTDAIGLLTTFTGSFIDAATPFVAVLKDVFDIVSDLPPEVASVTGKIGFFSVGILAAGTAITTASDGLKALSF